jgi:hypothetical protein
MRRRKRDGKAVARAAAAAGADGGRKPGRFSARRKTEPILRMLRGEPLDSLARELGVTAATLAHWREEFLAGGWRRTCLYPDGGRANEPDLLALHPAALLLERRDLRGFHHH